MHEYMNVEERMLEEKSSTYVAPYLQVGLNHQNPA